MRCSEYNSFFFFSDKTLQMDSDNLDSNLSNVFDAYTNISLQCANITILSVSLRHYKDKC